MSMLRHLSIVTALAVAASTALLVPASARPNAQAGPGTAAVGWPPAPPTQLVIDTQGVDHRPRGLRARHGDARRRHPRHRGARTRQLDVGLGQEALQAQARGGRRARRRRGLRRVGAAGGLRRPQQPADGRGLRRRVPDPDGVDARGSASSRSCSTARCRASTCSPSRSRQGSGRVDLPDDGYLLEINQRYLRDGEPGFRTGRGTPVAFKDPDEVTKRQRREVRARGDALREGPLRPVVRRPDAAATRRTSTSASVIDWYIVEELFSNQDSNFQSSVNFSWVPGKKFVFGPVWDFDLSAGTRWRAYGPSGRLVHPPGPPLGRSDARGPGVLGAGQEPLGRLRPGVARGRRPAARPAADALAPAAHADWRQWHDPGDLEWTQHAKTRTGEVDFLGDWLTQRIAWLSKNEVRLGTTRQGTQERERTVWVPVQLQTPRTEAVDVAWTVQAGSATAGVDFVAEEGQVTFAPGQMERYIPVRILDDAETERLRDPAGAPHRRLARARRRLAERRDGRHPGPPPLRLTGP